MMLLPKVFAVLDLSPLPKAGANGDGSPIQTILTVFWAIAGAVCMLIITIAGLKFVLSRGEPQAIAKAKNTIIYAVLGLVISITATAIVGFVFNRI